MLKNVLPIKNVEFLINHIQGIISSYHLVARQLHYRLKQDNFQNYHPNMYLQKVY